MSPEQPVLSRAEIRAVDRLALSEYGMPGVLLMENAGAGAARVLLAEAPQSVAILCGSGNNGGDGYVVARHLVNCGVRVRVLEFAEPKAASGPHHVEGDATIMRTIVARMAAKCGAELSLHAAWKGEASAWRAALEGCDWIVDALLGTGFEGEVREPLAQAIRTANELRATASGRVRCLALDLPSGLDADTGLAARDTIRADMTVTFAAKKRGLLAPGAAEFVGELRVASIGVPLELLSRFQAGS